MSDKNEKFRRWASEKKDELIKRSGNRCERCHKGFTISCPARIHHIVYKKDMNSLLYICDPCHKLIHAKQDEKAFLRKMLTWFKKNTPDPNYKVKDVMWEIKEGLRELGKDKDIP